MVYFFLSFFLCSQANTSVQVLTFFDFRTFENVYIGWGIKHSSQNFDPSLPAFPMAEYPSGKEITEDEDPTPEVEAAWRKRLEELALEEEGQEEGHEESEDDY